MDVRLETLQRRTPNKALQNALGRAAAGWLAMIQWRHGWAPAARQLKGG